MDIFAQAQATITIIALVSSQKQVAGSLRSMAEYVELLFY